MTQTPLISIIVPVYKVESYLDKCIRSIAEQTYTNLEIILVDDGSPDSSGVICDQWAQRDPRIRVIHQKNAGGGFARNAGFDIAQGEFIGLVDSDDYIAPDMYTHLLNYMDNDVDIVECNMIKTFDDIAVFSHASVTNAEIYNVSDAMRLHICDRLFCQTPPNKLYRRSVVADVRFPSGTGIDDEYWTYRVIGNAKKLVHVPLNFYAYRQHEGSVMHSLTIPKQLRAIEAKVQRYEYISKYFPSLVPLCQKDLWFSCLYQGQVLLRSPKSYEQTNALLYLQSVLQSHPGLCNESTLKELLWLNLMRLSFLTTCRLRNLLKIGL